MTRLISLLLLCFIFTPALTAATLKIDDIYFTLDGERFDLWGIRTASATKNPQKTQHLIDQLDSYLEHNVNTVAVYFQGSSGGSYDPFSPDGKKIDPQHLQRMAKIIEECNKRDMIVIVGIFYQMQRGGGTPVLEDWAACKNAVKTVTKWLKQKEYQNVILNIANEQNSHGHRGQPWERVRNVDDLIDLVQIAKEIDPNRIVGCGGYDHDKNIDFGLSPHVDALLFDTLGPNQQDHSGKLHDRFKEAGIDNKPMVNVEMFGGWTKKFMPVGVYDPAGRAEHVQEIIDAVKRPALSVCFHSNTWCQGPSVDSDVRYNLGGMGTTEAPGIHWYFNSILNITQE